MMDLRLPSKVLHFLYQVEWYLQCSITPKRIEIWLWDSQWSILKLCREKRCNTTEETNRHTAYTNWNIMVFYFRVLFSPNTWNEPVSLKYLITLTKNEYKFKWCGTEFLPKKPIYAIDSKGYGRHQKPWYTNTSSSYNHKLPTSATIFFSVFLILKSSKKWERWFSA